MTSLSKSLSRESQSEAPMTVTGAAIDAENAGEAVLGEGETEAVALSAETPDRQRWQFRFGDLVGGLTGMAVALPQSMGLGIALFLSMGLGASSGALAGLIGAAAISLVSGAAGNTRGMISAPNGPVVIFLIGALASFAAGGVGTADLPTVLAALVVFAGCFQILLAVSGGGQLIKYIPYPVVTGLVTAIGVLMVVSQLPSLFGGSEGVSKVLGIAGTLLIEAPHLNLTDHRSELLEAAWALVPAATAAVTMLGIYLVPRWLPRIPGIVGGFAVGLIFFHLAMAVSPGAVPDAWIVGRIPGLEALALDVSAGSLTGLPWHLIVVSALALAVVTSIDCMVTAVVADAATGSRHNARGELIAQGVGQITAGLLGGCGGGGTKGSTLTAIHSGGRRWPAVVAALSVVALMLFLRRLGEFLPISVLAAVIIHVGFHMLDWRIISWLRSKKARIDGVLAFVVVAATVIFDVMTGVGVGAVSAAVLFIRSQSAATAIHERATGKERRSLRHRTKEESKLLDALGDRILYVELRGHLFFGTVDRLFTELYDDLRRPVWIVINMRRVQSLDMSGLNLLRQMTALITANGGHIVFANVYPGVAPDRKMTKVLRLLDPGDRGLKAKTFKNADKALQYAEDQLLTEAHRPAAGRLRQACRGRGQRPLPHHAPQGQGVAPQDPAAGQPAGQGTHLHDRRYRQHPLPGHPGRDRHSPRHRQVPLQASEAGRSGGLLRRDELPQSRSTGHHRRGHGRRRTDGPGSGFGKGRRRLPGQGSHTGPAKRNRPRPGRPHALGQYRDLPPREVVTSALQQAFVKEGFQCGCGEGRLRFRSRGAVSWAGTKGQFS